MVLYMSLEMTSEYQFCARCIKTKAIMATTETVSAFTIKCHFSGRSWRNSNGNYDNGVVF